VCDHNAPTPAELDQLIEITRALLHVRFELPARLGAG